MSPKGIAAALTTGVLLLSSCSMEADDTQASTASDAIAPTTASTTPIAPTTAAPSTTTSTTTSTTSTAPPTSLEETLEIMETLAAHRPDLFLSEVSLYGRGLMMTMAPTATRDDAKAAVDAAKVHRDIPVLLTRCKDFDRLLEIRNDFATRRFGIPSEGGYAISVHPGKCIVELRALLSDEEREMVARLYVDLVVVEHGTVVPF